MTEKYEQLDKKSKLSLIKIERLNSQLNKIKDEHLEKLSEIEFLHEESIQRYKSLISNLTDEIECLKCTSIGKEEIIETPNTYKHLYETLISSLRDTLKCKLLGSAL